MANILTGMMGAAGVVTGGTYVGAPPDGYRAWYRSDTVTESGGEVSQWDDKSDNDFHIGAWDDDFKPTYNTTDSNFANHPTINLGVDDGEETYKFANIYQEAPLMSDWQDNTTTALFKEFTWAIVWRATTGQTPAQYSPWIGDFQGYMHFGMDSTTTMSIGNSPYQRTQTGLSLGTTYASIVNAEGGTDNFITITIETTGITTASSSTWNSTNVAHGRAWTAVIGGGSVPSQYIKGQIADIIIYNTSLDSSDTTTLKNYFANSYDLTW